MKHRVRLYSAALLFSAAPFVVLSCKKDESASSPAGPAAAKADAVVSAPAWGYAARLPKNTEGFFALYRLSDLVEGFKNSNFLKKVMSNPDFVRQFDLAQLEQMTSSPDFKEGMAFASEIVGKEVVVALADGFTDNAARIVKSLIPLIKAGVQQSIEAQMKPPAEPGVAAAEPSPIEMLMEKDPAAVAAMVQDLIDSDIPPFCIAVNAGGAREKLTGLLQQALEGLPPQAKAMLDTGSFKLDGKYDIQTFTFTAAKAIPPEAVAGIEQKLGMIVNDPAKAASLTAKLLTKTAELSWGWVDDHLLIALGKDHSHVKLATVADGVFSVPEVASRILTWQPKRPVSVAYSSLKMSRAMGDAMSGMGTALFSLMQQAGGQFPFPLDGIMADLKKLSARAKELWPGEPAACIAAAWWEGGLHGEMFGGAKPGAFDSSKPLTYGSLAGPATVFLSESRVNEAARDKAFGFVEEAAITLWDSFQKNIKPSLPDDLKQNLAMGEPVVLPLLKSLWKSVQDFRAAMGNESALLVNLDGAMPDSPQLGVPPDMKGIKIPRILVVSDLKDRAKLTESWTGMGGLIGTVVAMAKVPVNPQPVEKQEGAVTLWGFELPLDTGDVWPHTAVAGNRWYMGTSPSFTKEAAAKTPAPMGPACGAHVRINFDAVWEYATTTMAYAPTASPQEKKMATDAIDLLRALSEVDARAGEDNGAGHCKLFIGIKDL